MCTHGVLTCPVVQRSPHQSPVPQPARLGMQRLSASAHVSGGRHPGCMGWDVEPVLCYIKHCACRCCSSSCRLHASLQYKERFIFVDLRHTTVTKHCCFDHNGISKGRRSACPCRDRSQDSNLTSWRAMRPTSTRWCRFRTLRSSSSSCSIARSESSCARRLRIMLHCILAV